MTEAPRIVSLLPAATEMLLAMGAEERLVGVSHLCDAPPEIPRILSSPIDSEGWDMKRINEEVRRCIRTGKPLYVPDEERIAALRPDVIFTQGLCPVCAAGPETVNGVALAARPRLVTLSPHTLEDVACSIETVGFESGVPEQGRKLARMFRSRVDAVRSSRSGRTPKPRVTVIEWFSPLWVSGEWISEMVEVAGAEYVPLGKGEGSRPASWNELVRAGPDIIILAPCSMTLERARRELHLLDDQPGWRALNAVGAGQYALMDGAVHFSSPGPRLAEGVEVLAEAIDTMLSGSKPPEHLRPWLFLAKAEERELPP